MTMTNAEWCIKNNIKFQEIHVPYDAKAKEAKIIYRNKEIGRSKFCDTSFTTLKVWLDMEHIEPILDDAEKRYLKGVIRPFKDRVKYIEKVCADHLYSEPDYYISIKFNDGSYGMNFPFFDVSHMYKCMKINRPYTLKELGL